MEPTPAPATEEAKKKLREKVDSLTLAEAVTLLDEKAAKLGTSTSPARRPRKAPAKTATKAPAKTAAKRAAKTPARKAAKSAR